MNKKDRVERKLLQKNAPNRDIKTGGGASAKIKQKQKSRVGVLH